ncbi:pseudaminic acid cytidylyltransferase [Paenimyroides aestuarii]|uniref:Pseudaminic acid cytidylyltransferase n=1 Tax=Paenimyroides aestuarii TaxID=2968490 RepID=A0ABY5NRT3_9FLAO|nr:pseudaminic acid cytidylyltransferase [Paenimyroides aestuarii]UUV21277.1 pseudaminic acid cytidylyltransferase [Paenimyroides aestuarii]
MSTTQNNLCIIPARGGSKRIPRKNIKDFLGKPIIAYSIEVALDSGLFSEVMVSTDDEEIAEVAKKYGAKVPFMRTEKTADDFATTMDVLVEVVDKYKKEGKYFKNVCCIYATSPLVSPEILKKSFDVYNEKKFDSLFSVIKYSFPIQRSLSVNDDKITFNYPENANKRSQDLNDSFHDAGQFYWMKENLICKGAVLVTKNTGAYEISELQGQDIDNELDWKLAELKYELLQSIK